MQPVPIIPPINVKADDKNDDAEITDKVPTLSKQEIIDLRNTNHNDPNGNLFELVKCYRNEFETFGIVNLFDKHHLLKDDAYVRFKENDDGSIHVVAFRGNSRITIISSNQGISSYTL